MEGSRQDVAGIGQASCRVLTDALARARSFRFLSWELRCAKSLASLKQQQNQLSVACELIVPVYERCARGMDSIDLKAARALIASLE